MRPRTRSLLCHPAEKAAAQDNRTPRTGAHSNKDRHRNRNGARGQKRDLPKDQATKEQVQKAQEARPERDNEGDQDPGKVAGKEKRETR
ncbi:MAG: hypothetical protein PWR07_1169 [Bacillota bacterium]|nr:hypothetical protein [Bacillota bacterium]